MATHFTNSIRSGESILDDNKQLRTILSTDKRQSTMVVQSTRRVFIPPRRPRVAQMETGETTDQNYAIRTNRGHPTGFGATLEHGDGV